MSRKRYVNSDPTAWKAIGWADRAAAKKDISPKAEKLKRSRIAVEGQENIKVYTYTKDGINETTEAMLSSTNAK